MPGHRSPLSITPDQTEFTERQLAALIALEMPEDAPEPWQAVFLHHIHTLGLDPFQGQIRLLRRSEPEVNGDGRRVVATRWSVETSIQGFRIGTRRAAERAEIRLHLSEQHWYDDRTGTWLEAWPYPQPPTAARFVLLTIDRNGEEEEVVGVVHHSEYAKTSVDGIATYGWARMPVHMLAKCAEVDAYRRRFPEELGGLNLAGLSPDTDTESRTRRTTLTTSPPNTETAATGPQASPSGLLSTPRRAPSAPPTPPHPPAEPADTPPAPAEPTTAAPGGAAAADTEAPRPLAPARRPKANRRPASATVTDAAVQAWLSEATEKLTTEVHVLAWAADRLDRPLADIGAITTDDLPVLKAALAATDIVDRKD